MTTSPEQQAPEDDSIPRWFHEFVRDNAAQHADLADRIAQSELRTTEQIAQLRVEMTQLEQRTSEQIAQLRLEMAQQTQRTSEQIGQLEQHTSERAAEIRLEMRTEIARSEGRVIRWMLMSIGALAALIGGLGGLAAFGG